MFNPVSFIACVRDNLKTKGFGDKRIKEIVDDITARSRGYESQGHNPAKAAALAQADVLNNMDRVAREAAKRNLATMATWAQVLDRIQEGADAPVSKFLMDGKRGSQGVAVARAAVAMVESDPRFNGLSYNSNKEATRGRLFAIFGEVLDSVGKGFLGRQKGKAHLPNIAREILGDNTGDVAAKAVAEAWTKVSDLAVTMFNNAGGTMNRLSKYLPQGQNAVRMTRAGKEAWTKDHMDMLDWNKTRWPDGTEVRPDQRQDLLDYVFDVMTTDGASKIDTSKLRGQGRALGNMIDDHRFMHYKNSKGWMDAHAKYGDGNVFEVLVNHVEQMSHKIAMVQTFGPNPNAMRQGIHAAVRKKAAEFGARAVSDADAILKNKFDPMMEHITRENPMDPHSLFGALVAATSNILTSSMLGSASFLAIPGDFKQTLWARGVNNMPLFGGVSTYLKSMLGDAAGMFTGKNFQQSIATQSGFVMDQVIAATHSTTRWTGLATVGPAWSRHLSEFTMRASLLAGHTKAARWAAQSEFMGLLQRSRSIDYEDLPFKEVMQRYGITKEAWDAVRNSGIKPWTPKAGTEFLRPLDILEADIGNKEDLYRRFAGMVSDESRHMVPDSTVEASTFLRGVTRPDTLLGMLNYSFSMFKNFPVSFVMIYGRLGMTQAKGKLASFAALGAGMTLVGALGTQLREVSKGRDLLPMDNAAFLGKAMLSGGALSIWGDFLFTGVNDYGSSPGQVAAGPLIGLLGDTTNLLLGDVFQWADNVGSLSSDFESNTASRAVEWARRYTPGSSIWWARAALERNVFDQLQLLADPRGAQRQRNKVNSRQRDYGQGHWWAPGEALPSRLPSFGG